MQFRAIDKKDLELVANLLDGYRVYYKKDSDYEGAKAFLSQRIQQQDSKIYVAETKPGTLAGFVQLYPLFSSTRMKKLWLLNDLFVAPAFRGQRVSVGLINKAKELVQTSGACGMFLETEKTNKIGNSLYPSVGFELNEGSNFYEWNNPS